MATTNGRPKAPETDENRAAFKRYVEMGAKRSLRALADEMGKSRSTIVSWNIKFDWPKRLKEIEQAKSAVLLSKITAEQVKEATELEVYKREAIARLVRHIDSKTTSVKELNTILRALKIELGEPTEIAKGIGDNDDSNPISDIITAVLTANATGKSAAGTKEE